MFPYSNSFIKWRRALKQTLNLNEPTLLKTDWFSNNKFSGFSFKLTYQLSSKHWYIHKKDILLWALFVWMCMRRSEVNIRHLPQLLSTLFFETVSHLNLLLSDLTRLVGQEASGIHLSLLLQGWNYNCSPLSMFFHQCTEVLLKFCVCMSIRLLTIFPTAQHCFS